MANVIDVLINASWTGGAAVTGASADLRGLSNAAAATSVEMAAGQQRASLLNTALADVGQQVALGTLTVEQGADAYQQYEASLADVGTVAPKTGINLASLTTKVFAVTAAFTAVTLAAKKGLEAIRSAAQLELTIQRFDRLAESIGTTGDALRKDLSIATRGLTSEMKTLASTTDFLALGLASDHDEAVRLTNVASQLGFDMNQLVLTLTNMTTMRFDALGVQVTGFQRRVENLTEAGHNAEDAFRLAFLEQAEEQIERVGSVADTTAGKINIIESAWEDLLDTLRLGTIDALGPLIDELASATIAGGDAARAASEFSKAAGDQDEQIAAVGELRAALEDLDSFLGVGVGLFSGVALDRATDSFLELAGEAAATGTTIEEQEQILRDLGFEVENGVVALGGYAVAWERVAEAIDSVRVESVIADVTKAVDLALDPLGDVAAASAEALGDLQKQVEAIEFKELLADVGLTKDEFTKLALEIGGTAEATEFLKIQAAGVPALLRDIADITDELGEQLAEQQAGRVDLFIDFQDELTQISFSEAERRSDIEASSEERRTEIVERHGERRARDEEDWARSRLRQSQRLQRDIDGVNADTADRAIELREDTDQRLEELERDHLGRIADIISNADLALEDAAGRLDAAAVTAITRQREAALKDERDDYAEQREDISRELQVRLAEERDAAAERIEEMQAFHAERQRIEEEDRQIRLDRQAQDHEAQLAALDAQHAQRLSQIMLDAAAERMVREDQYGIDRTQLVDNLQNRADDQQKWMDDILTEEAAWWEARMDLIPDVVSGDGRPPPSGGFQPAPAITGSTTPVSIASGGITIPVTAAEGQSPLAVAENVAEVLEGIFERFQ